MTGSGAAAGTTVSLGRCDEMRAEVLVHLDPAGATAPPRIAGTLTGPRRGRDTTLPTTTRLQPTAAPGLVRAILTEPAYWTPDLPNLYRLEATVESGHAPPRLIDRLVGLRRLGVRGRSFWLDGRRWVPRAARVGGVAGIDSCKPAGLAALVAEPDEATLARADETGVAVLALVSTTPPDPAAVADRVAKWAEHPSVVVGILPPDLPLTVATDAATAMARRKGTLLLTTTVPGAHPPPAIIPAGIDALVVACDGAALPHDAWRVGAPVPLIAWRRVEGTPGGGRKPCDSLQSALAAWGTAGGRDTLNWDWAGFVTG